MMQEKEHVLKVLEEVKKALNEKDYLEIKILSDKIIHISSVHQDSDIISLSVIIYALSKILERRNYKEEKNWAKFFKRFVNNIDDMILALKKNDFGVFHDEIEENRKLIQGLSGNLKGFIKDVFRRARVNKASRIYEHGISMEKTAKILGISLWELSEYAGKTGIGNVNLAVTVPIRQRIKFAEEIFER
ncbi:hypothetical protein HOE04_03550 [archaeon]|nr:hypothetical protein [archaeon]